MELYTEPQFLVTALCNNSFGQKLMRIYNQKGIFSNTKDSEEGLTHILSEHFENVKTKVKGTVVMFSASGKNSIQPQHVLAHDVLRHNPNDYSQTGFTGHSISGQLMYQLGSATPDTSSRLPATRFLPPYPLSMICRSTSETPCRGYQ